MADPEPRAEGRSIPYRLIAAAIAVVIVLILIIQNASQVTVDWLFWSTDISLALLVVIVAVLSFVAGWLFARMRRQR